MAPFRTKTEFAALFRSMSAEESQAKGEIEAAATQRTEQAFVPPQVSSRGKMEMIQTTPFPFANDQDESLFFIKKIVLAWQQNEQALEDLLSEQQVRKQEVERAEARDKEDADVFDEVSVKVLRVGRVKARLPLFKRGLDHPREQGAELVTAPSRFEELKDMIGHLTSHELFTSGRAQPPQLPNDEELAKQLRIPLGMVHLPMTDSQRLGMQQTIAALRQNADGDLADYKAREAEIEERRRLAAQKWEETSKALQRQAEKRESNKRTTWFETTMQDLRSDAC
jgi:hypothetical protein